MEDGGKAVHEKMPSAKLPARKGMDLGEFKLKRQARTVIFTALGLVAILAGLYACLTHGWLWSIYVPIYGRFLHSMPSPPGVVEGTETTTLNPELPWGYKQYQVNQPHGDTVNFFTDDLPTVGWNLLEHKAWQSELGQGRFLSVDRMLFSRHSRYWLVVGISTTVGADGAALEPSDVIVEVHRNKQQATRRY
jgi:hypothetical protein